MARGRVAAMRGFRPGGKVSRGGGGRWQRPAATVRGWVVMGFARCPGVPVGRAKPSSFARHHLDFVQAWLSILARLPCERGWVYQRGHRAFQAKQQGGIAEDARSVSAAEG